MFLVIPDEEAAGVIKIWDVGRHPGDFQTVWSNLAKSEICGGWYSC